MSISAKTNPNKFFIGVDANVKPLEKPSIKATRKPLKGGLPNALFVQASAEELPEEFNGIATEIYINFPWGSLLRGVLVGDGRILTSLRRITKDNGSLTIVTGIDPERDRTEIERLEIPRIDTAFIRNELVTRYSSAGFGLVDIKTLDARTWKQVQTSWAKKLSGNHRRDGLWLQFTAT